MTEIGMVLGMIGAVIEGFVVPRYTAVAYGGEIQTKAPGTWWSRVAWILIASAFGLQLFDAT